MDRLFLDACVVFSAAYNPSSPPRRLWELGDATLLASDFVLEEARRNLAVLRPERLDDLRQLSEKLEIVVATLTVVPSEAQRLPDKDFPILLAAVAGRATHLLTVDKKHFGSLFGKTVGKVLVLSPGEVFDAAAVAEIGAVSCPLLVMCVASQPTFAPARSFGA